MMTSLILSLLLLQYPYPYPTRSVVPRGPVNPGGANTDAVATFAGTFKSADKKFLTIEVDEGNTLRMYITGSTKFFRDGKQVKASDFESGEKVTVDASRDARMNLLAVRIEPAKPPAKEEKAPAPKSDQ